MHILAPHRLLTAALFLAHLSSTLATPPTPTPVTPPGYYTTGGQTLQCANGSFRADWKATADTCITCGEGVQADKTDRVTSYNIITNAATQIPVTTSTSDCCKCRGWAMLVHCCG